MRTATARPRTKLLEPSTRLVPFTPYRTGPETSKLKNTKLNKILSENIIEPAQTEWASPKAFAPKKNGIPRFSVKYRKLNAVTQRDSYPIPRMDERINLLGDAPVFSTLGGTSGY